MKAHTNYTTVIAATPWARHKIAILAALLTLAAASIALTYTLRYNAQHTPAVLALPAAQAPAAINWRFRDEALAGVQPQQAIGDYTMPERLADVRQARPAAPSAAPAPAQLHGAFNRIFADELFAPLALPAGSSMDAPATVQRVGPQ